MDHTRFDWDDANIRHIAEHDVIPDEAEEVVTTQPLTVEYQNVAGEPRERLIGDHDDELTDDFETAADATLEVAATRVLLPNKDAVLARTQAAAKGLDYQAYLATLIHDALQRAEHQP